MHCLSDVPLALHKVTFAFVHCVYGSVWLSNLPPISYKCVMVTPRFEILDTVHPQNKWFIICHRQNVYNSLCQAQARLNLQAVIPRLDTFSQ